MFKKRAVFNQLTVLIKSTHLLSGKISSSRETHSSSTLLLSTRDDTKAKKQGKVTLIFLWNLSKAFIPWNTEPSYIKWANLDFPNHSLKQQLITFMWKRTICAERFQKINLIKKKPWCPPGSYIMFPLTFNIHEANLQTATDRCNQYADDTTLYAYVEFFWPKASLP